MGPHSLDLSINLLRGHPFRISCHGLGPHRVKIPQSLLARQLLFTAAGAAVMLAFSGDQYALSVGAMLGFGLNFAYSWAKYIKSKDSKVVAE